MLVIRYRFVRVAIRLCQKKPGFTSWERLFWPSVEITFSLQGFSLKNSQVLVFIILTVCATLSQIYEVEGTYRNTYYPHSLFFLAAAVMLDPFLFSLVVIIPHSAEWIQKRLKKSTNLKAWYIQPFNIATHILAGYAVLLLNLEFTNYGLLDTMAGPLFIIILAFVYTVLNHFLIGMVLLLARGLSFFRVRSNEP